jgi:hypothetical protein
MKKSPTETSKSLAEYWLENGVNLKTPPNKDKVAILASHTLTDEEIAATLGISPKQLVQSYGGVLRRQRLAGKGQVRSSQYRLAIKGNAIAQIWLGKQVLNQADKVETTLIGTTKDVAKVKRKIEHSFGASVKTDSKPSIDVPSTVLGTPIPEPISIQQTANA